MSAPARARAWTRALAKVSIGARTSLPADPLDDAGWRELSAGVRAERLEPALAAAVNSGAWPSTPTQCDDALERHASVMATAVLLDRELIEMAERFERHDVGFRVLKGAAVAHLDYPSPSSRAYGDIDALIPADRIAAAAEALSAGGGQRIYREPRPGFDRRFGKGLSFRMPSGSEIDLHRTLALGPFGVAIDLEELWRESEEFSVAARRFTALDRNRRFIHACYHAALGRARPRLAPLIDLTRQAPTSDDDVDEVVRMVSSWRGGPVVRLAFAAASELGWEAPPSLRAGIARLTETTQEKRWLSAYRGARRSSVRQSLYTLEALDGWSDRTAFARAAIWPDDRTARDVARRLASGIDSMIRTKR